MARVLRAAFPLGLLGLLVARSVAAAPQAAPQAGRRVAVVGAGAAGLSAARHLSAAGIPHTVFEQSGDIGGTWAYTDQVGVDEFGLPVHSSMYRNLRLNIPKQVMVFPDFKIKNKGRSYAKHQEIKEYLDSYAQHFDLLPNIKLFSHVEQVAPLGSRWNVTVLDLKAGRVDEHVFDAVLVCNGKDSVPHAPSINNVSLFRGLSMHSHDYREPSRFQGADVVVLGAGASGVDIAVEVSSVANKVYWSHNREPFTARLPDNVHQVKGVRDATEHGFVLHDNTTVQADAIVMATGYELTFPFLAPELGVRVVNKTVPSLHKNLLHRERPTLALLGLNCCRAPFVVFHYQARYFVAAFLGRIPVTEAQRRDDDEISDTWEYLQDLAASGRFEDDMWPVVTKVNVVNLDERKNFVLSYRDVDYLLKDRDSYERFVTAGSEIANFSRHSMYDTTFVSPR